MLLIDPPEGWMYGFPKPYTKKPEEMLVSWLIANGYPQHKCTDNNMKHIRYIGHYEELIENKEKNNL